MERRAEENGLGIICPKNDQECCARTADPDPECNSHCDCAFNADACVQKHKRYWSTSTTTWCSECSTCYHVQEMEQLRMSVSRLSPGSGRSPCHTVVIKTSNSYLTQLQQQHLNQTGPEDCCDGCIRGVGQSGQIYWHHYASSCTCMMGYYQAHHRDWGKSYVLEAFFSIHWIHILEDCSMESCPIVVLKKSFECVVGSVCTRTQENRTASRLKSIFQK